MHQLNKIFNEFCDLIKISDRKVVNGEKSIHYSKFNTFLVRLRIKKKYFLDNYTALKTICIINEHNNIITYSD